MSATDLSSGSQEQSKLRWIAGAVTALTLMLCLCPQVDAQVKVDFRDHTYLGKLDGFYRGTQLQGNGLKGRIGLVKVPDFLLKTSFPYKKRPYPEEILFVDKISIVRFLGGWSPRWTWGEAGDDIKQGDLAYVDEKGEVKYRWNLLKPRLDPYIQMGYTQPIITLDNVPYDLAAYESQGGYGQVAPPRDYEEWGRFIEELCRQLVKLYGFEMVNSWSFKIGNEVHGASRGKQHTFDGDHDDFVAMYDWTAAAVKKVLPGARFGPAEFAGRIWEEGPEPPAVNWMKLADHCVNGQNFATGQAGSPFDFLSNSAYGAAWRLQDGRLSGTIDPRWRLRVSLGSYANILGRHESLRNIPIYTFQFGVLGSEYKYNGRPVGSSEPGGRGAAWTFHVLMGMKESLKERLEGNWHWGAAEHLGEKDGKTRYLLYGYGWVHSVLDHLVGGDAYVLGAPDLEGEKTDFSLDTDFSTDFSLDTVCKVLFVRKGDSYYVVTSAINLDRSVKERRAISISIPREQMDLGERKEVQWVSLTEENCPFRAVKKDLAAEGLLKPAFKDIELLAYVFAMGGHPGRDYVLENYARYEALQIESLTLGPFSGTLEETEGGYELTYSVEPSSVTVIAINHRPSEIL